MNYHEIIRVSYAEARVSPMNNGRSHDFLHTFSRNSYIHSCLRRRTLLYLYNIPENTYISINVHPYLVMTDHICDTRCKNIYLHILLGVI